MVTPFNQKIWLSIPHSQRLLKSNWYWKMWANPRSNRFGLQILESVNAPKNLGVLLMNSFYHKAVCETLPHQNDFQWSYLMQAFLI